MMRSPALAPALATTRGVALACAPALALACALAPSPALAAEPTAQEILARYDALMGPPIYEAENEMSSTRDDGTTRTYLMLMLKRDQDKFRIWFKEPASVKGQEVLRIGDNMWIYLPNLKRATRVANRESFQGGDFNNADVLRVNYSADYDGALAPSDLPETWCVRLKAKNAETAYDAITLYVRKADLMPVKGHYYGTSGKMIRSADFTEVKELQKGFSRPTKVVMHNELVPARSSTMLLRRMRFDVDAPPQRFQQADLGK